MRLWIGKEQEGIKKGTTTLFVDATSINFGQEKVIEQYLRKHKVSRVYLGAGKNDLLDFSTTLLDSTLKGFEIVVECTLKKSSIWIPFLNRIDELIVRIDNETIDARCEKIVLKIDNGSTVGLFYDRVINSIDTVKNGMYANDDKLVWED